MSDKEKVPEQLSLPFMIDAHTTQQSARVFFLRDHFPKVNSFEISDGESISKERERKILDRVLERAERLNWYK